MSLIKNKTKYESLTKIKLSTLLLVSFVILMIASSTIYSLTFFVGLTNEVKLIRFLILILFFGVGISFLFYKKKMLWNASIASFVCLLFVGSITTILLNEPREYLPSLTRYVLYILTANVFFMLSSTIGSKKINLFFKRLAQLFLTISILFGFHEILTGQVEYINGDFRVAGPFKKHQLAFAMFLFVNLVLHVEFNLRMEKNNIRKVFNYILFLLSFYLLLRTGSRALIIIFFLSYFALHIFNAKSFRYIFKTILTGILIASMFVAIVATTNISPRLKYMFTSGETIYDPSTMTRILIITNSIGAFEREYWPFGIGIGGFNNFYLNTTGRDHVAAHNNYLLFLIESGIIGLIIFLIYQIVTFYIFLKLVRRKPNAITRSAFLLYIGIDVLCFLQNNYYFFTQESIVWMIYGVAFYLNRRDFVEYESEISKNTVLLS
ncbi:O-antigen ligase family protein [Reichenbachiella sp.]|uniref:O-antigen ligase family protein n=1 Tax=Reichenbachiella sp. TaxID=2184521 RepID=UPI003BAEAEEA